MGLLRRASTDLPLRWKLLLPFLVLLVAVGTLGTFVLVRDQATRAQTSLDGELQQRGLEVRSIARDRELYVVESGTFAANLQGMSEALQARDSRGAAALLQSVMALKGDLVLAVVTDGQGMALAQYSRVRAAGPVTADPPATLATVEPVATALRGQRSEAVLAGFSGRRMVLLAVPVCPPSGACTPVGFGVVGIDATSLLLDPQGRPAVGSDARLALFDGSRQLVTSSPPGSSAPAPPDGTSTRVLSGQVATLYTPYTLQGRRAGTLAVSLPTAPAYGSVRSATTQLVLLLLLAIAGTVIIVAVLTTYILRRLEQLVATNRELAAGDLSARAPAHGQDEIGQLARGVNSMAASLQESYETLETRVEERTADVRRLLDERTEFFTAVSHEFRTPLAVIQAHADMLASDDFDKSREWNFQAGESISEASRQLLSFVNDILDLSRAERGALDLDLVEVDLAGLVQEIQPSAETLASTGGLTVRFSVTRDLPAVRADRGRMRQVLLNLVDNAIKYTPRGGTVDVGLAEAGDQVELRVADSGVGIPAAEVERVFEPFYRVKSTQPQNGQPSSGVGLALVRQIVDAHGGTIDVTSSPGAGTSFLVRLPALPSRPARPARPRSTRRTAPARD